MVKKYGLTNHSMSLTEFGSKEKGLPSIFENRTIIRIIPAHSVHFKEETAECRALFKGGWKLPSQNGGIAGQLEKE